MEPQSARLSIQHLTLHSSRFTLLPLPLRAVTIPPEGPPRSHDAYAALRISDFRRILISHATSTVAREGQMVGVGWQVYEHTRDPLSLGLIGLAEALPFIAVALLAGHAADRA